MRRCVCRFFRGVRFIVPAAEHPWYSPRSTFWRVTERVTFSPRIFRGGNGWFNVKETLRILILEDRPADAELVTRELRQAGFEFAAKVVATEKEFLAELRDSAPHLILADYSLPGYSGLVGAGVGATAMSGDTRLSLSPARWGRRRRLRPCIAARPTTCSSSGWRGWSPPCAARCANERKGGSASKRRRSGTRPKLATARCSNTRPMAL